MNAIRVVPTNTGHALSTRISSGFNLMCSYTKRFIGINKDYTYMSTMRKQPIGITL